MRPWVLLLALGYVVLECVVAALLASVVGWGWVIIIMLALIIVGAAVMRRAGMSAARSLRDGTTPSGVPAAGTGRAVGDASLQFVAGAFIALPGLVSSAFGILLLIRPVRRVIGGALVIWFTARLRRQGLSMTSTFDDAGTRVTRIVPGDVVEGEVVPNSPPEPPPAVGT